MFNSDEEARKEVKLRTEPAESLPSKKFKEGGIIQWYRPNMTQVALQGVVKRLRGERDDLEQKLNESVHLACHLHDSNVAKAEEIKKLIGEDLQGAIINADLTTANYLLQKQIVELTEELESSQDGYWSSLTKFLRRVFSCSRDVHWSMEYDNGATASANHPSAIGSISCAGTCKDCGYRTEGVIWPTMPECKPPTEE